jgi:hypothetical protein
MNPSRDPNFSQTTRIPSSDMEPNAAIIASGPASAKGADREAM